MQVALRAFPDEVALTAKGHHVRFAERLPLVRGVQHHFHGGYAAQAQRIQNGHAVVGVGTRVQHDAVHPARCGLNFVHEVALVVGLAAVGLDAQLFAACLHIVHDGVIIQLTGHARL